MNAGINVALIWACGCSLLAAASAEIATWRGNAKAALSIMVDDYGRRYWGDMDFAERVCDETGIKLSFAVNTHIDDPGDVHSYDVWGDARRLQAKGHEFHSHSATHDGGDWNADDLQHEIADSQALIREQIPGWDPMVFLFPNKGKDPNGLANEMAFLKAHRFIGVRPNRGFGVDNLRAVNDATVPDPFGIVTFFYQDKVGVEKLLAKVIDPAIEAWCLGDAKFPQHRQQKELGLVRCGRF